MATGGRAWAVFAVFACAWLSATIRNARAKPFWHDEIYTILHADLASLGQMWAAGIDGLDLSPPLNAWLTRGVHAMAGIGPIATRVPAMIGYLLMSALIFQIIRKRAGMAAALAGAILPCFTAAYRYGYEARAYGLMVGLFALALYAWTEAAAGARRSLNLALLAVALSASLLNHYFGVLTFIPILAGEAVRWFQRRRPDVPVLAATFVALCSGAVLWPLASAARAQTATFWSSAATSGVTRTYAYLFAPLVDARFAVAAVAIGVLLVWSRRNPAPAPPRTLPAHETAAVAVAVLIPALGVGLAESVTGVFVPRYAMSAVVGVSLAIPLLVWRLNRPASGAEWLLCAVLALSFAPAGIPMRAAQHTLADPYASRPLLRDALRSGPPVVVTGNIQFLQLWYYAPPVEKGRMRYLADVDQARKHLGFDTVDLGYLALRRWTAVPVENYGDYVRAHGEFRVYVAGGGWLLPSLEANGAEIQDLGREAGGRLVLVGLPRSADP